MADVVSSTLTDEMLDAGFSAWHGAVNGAPFTVWTENRVYFPAQYDGAEWCESVARHPDGRPTDHIGG